MEPPFEEKTVRDGHRFSFYALLRLLESLEPDAPPIGGRGPVRREPVRLRPELSLAFPASDVIAVERERTAERERHRVTVSFLGLYGTDSPLPLFYTEQLLDQENEGPARVRAFLDLLHHRLLSLLYREWTKYRYEVTFRPGGADPFSQSLLPLTGFSAAPALRDVPQVPLIRYLGLLTQLPRSASGLESLVSDFFGGIPVRVEQCVLRWVKLAEGMRNSVGTRNCGLGTDMILGGRVRDRRGKFRITIGPVGLQGFLQFIPSGIAFKRLCGLIRLYVTDPLDFEMEVVLRGDEVPKMELTPEAPNFLGWTGWLRTRPGADVSVVFQAR